MAVDRTAEFFSLAATLSASKAAAPVAIPSKGAAAGHNPLRAAASVGASTVAPLHRSAPKSAFIQAMRDVSHDLHTTSTKLAALTRLVKRRGMFADPTDDIERLTAAVKSSMSAITTRLDALDDYVAAKKREADGRGLRAGDGTVALMRAIEGSGGGAGGASGSGAAAGGAAAAAAAAGGGAASDTVLASVQGISHSSVAIGSMRSMLLGYTASLKGVLETRTHSLKSQAERRHALGGMRDLGAPVASSALAAAAATAAAGGGFGSSSSSGGGGLGHSAIAVTPASDSRRADRLGLGGGADPFAPSSFARPSSRLPGAAGGASTAAAAGGGFGSLGSGAGGGGGGGSAADLFAPLSQEQTQALMLAPQTGLSEQAYLESRATDVQAVERHIAELGTLFNRLSTVIAEQGSLVERIGDNVESSHRDLEAGVGELTTWRERVFDNRRLALKIVGIIVLFIFLFVFFMT